MFLVAGDSGGGSGNVTEVYSGVGMEYKGRHHHGGGDGGGDDSDGMSFSSTSAAVMMGYGLMEELEGVLAYREMPCEKVGGIQVVSYCYYYYYYYYYEY